MMKKKLQRESFSEDSNLGQNNLPKIKRDLIVYDSQKYQLDLPKRLKYGFRSSNLNIEDFKEKRSQYKKIFKFSKQSTTKNLKINVSRQKPEIAHFLRERVSFLQKVTLSFDQDHHGPDPELQLRVWNSLTRNKRLQVLNVRFEGHSNIFTHTKPMSFFSNLKTLFLTYACYQNQDQDPSQILLKEMKNIHKRGIGRQLTNQHFYFKMMGFLITTQTPAIERLIQIQDLNKNTQTDYSFYFSFDDNVNHECHPDFIQSIEKIRCIKFLHLDGGISENPDMSLLLNTLKYNNVQSLKMELQTYDEQHKKLLTCDNFRSVDSFSIKFAFDEGKQFTIFAKNLGKLSQLTSLEICSPFVGELQNGAQICLANSLKKLTNLESLSVDFGDDEHSNTESKSSGSQNIFIALGSLSQLKSLHVSYSTNEVKVGDKIKILWCTLKKLQNLQTLKLNFQGHEIGDKELLALCGTLPHLKQLNALELKFYMGETYSKNTIFTILERLSLIKSLYSLFIVMESPKLNRENANRVFKIIDSMKSLEKLRFSFRFPEEPSDAINNLVDDAVKRMKLRMNAWGYWSSGDDPDPPSLIFDDYFTFI